MDIKEERKSWKEVKEGKRFLNAFRGIKVYAATETSLIRRLFGLALVVALSFYLHISSFEWIAVLLSIGFVYVSEMLNTAIEIDIDLTSPEYHPYARDTKDVAAGAVLVSAIFSSIVGLIIFLPKIVSLIQ